MCDIYPVLLDERQVGSASVCHEGLYACISCQCCVDDQQLYRIQLKQDGGVIDLGTCLRSPDGYRIDTRIPMKMLKGSPEFYIRPKTGQKGKFYPIVPNKAFLQLDLLISGTSCRKCFQT